MSTLLERANRRNSGASIDTRIYGSGRTETIGADVGLQPRTREAMEAGLPWWVSPIQDRLSELLALPAGWNGHNARPVDRAAVRLLFEVLTRIFDDGEERPLPQLVPTPSGGLQLEWHTRGIDLELSIASTGGVDAFFDDEIEQKSWDGSFVDRESDVLRGLQTVSERLR